jgi:hypothetical protein
LDHVLAPRALEGSVRVELLDAVVAVVGDVDVIRRVDPDAVRTGELAAEPARGSGLAVRGHGADLEAGSATLIYVLPPDGDEMSVGAELRDPVVARQVDVALRVGRDAERDAERAADARVRALVAGSRVPYRSRTCPAFR